MDHGEWVGIVIGYGFGTKGSSDQKVNGLMSSGDITVLGINEIGMGADQG